jgi:para-aminobenzoate synthetase component 1
LSSFTYVNELAKQRKPFLFLSDFLAKKIEVYPLENLQEYSIKYSIGKNLQTTQKKKLYNIRKKPLSFTLYKKKFDKVIEYIKSGESYLLNLTQPTPVELNLSLTEVFDRTQAEYKLLYKDKFVCFSPEKFIKIKDGYIDTFPMKGTIDASIEDAKEKILADTKEMAEHIMVVDLLRNDLSIVAKKVNVKKFRYVTKLSTNEKDLLQVSSHINGYLGDDWHERLGDILSSILPAGSISGTPKKRTIEIIQEIEGYERDFFSGVFGVYDGTSFDSGVMIRFIEKEKGNFIYKSGGGITLDSNARDEYEELLSKIYLP